MGFCMRIPSWITSCFSSSQRSSGQKIEAYLTKIEGIFARTDQGHQRVGDTTRLKSLQGKIQKQMGEFVGDTTITTKEGEIEKNSLETRINAAASRIHSIPFVDRHLKTISAITHKKTTPQQAEFFRELYKGIQSDTEAQSVAGLFNEYFIITLVAFSNSDKPSNDIWIEMLTKIKQAEPKDFSEVKHALISVLEGYAQRLEVNIGSNSTITDSHERLKKLAECVRGKLRDIVPVENFNSRLSFNLLNDIVTPHPNKDNPENSGILNLFSVLHLLKNRE